MAMNILPFGVGLLFALGSTYFLVRSVASLAAARASRAWPRTEGTILESRAVRMRSTSSHRTLFVRYEYSVDGTPFVGTRDAFYTLTGREAQELARRHDESPAVAVFYDPAAPAESTLVVGPRPHKPYSDLILSLLGLLVGLGLAAGAATGAVG